MFRKTCALLLLSLVAASVTAQEIFRTTDEDGNVVFTDQPPAGSAEAERIELQRTNTTPATPLPPRPTPDPLPKAPAFPDFDVAVSSPPNETTIAMGPGNFSVSASVRPSLVDGTLLQLYMDGTPWGDAQRETTWSMTNVFRGAHDITVAVVDEDGKQLTTSAPVRVYVLRPSINSPARRGNN
jgi:hypothetical protein